MATSPVNQQRTENHNPLHNISFLKWGNKSHANSLHRTRRPTDPLPTLEHDRRLPTSQTGVESREMFQDMGRLTAQEDRGGGIERSLLIGGSLTDRKRFDFSSSLPVKEKGIQIEDGYVDDMDEEADAEGREELQKLWNLRPRKTPAAKNGHQIGASSKTIDAHVSSNGGFQDDANAPKSLRLRGMADAAHGGVEKKKERAKLWISLSKEEIEEDIFILTGSRPARRPKRRPKTVQKQLDIVFPGLSLLGVTAESFKIPHSPPKK